MSQIFASASASADIFELAFAYVFASSELHALVFAYESASADMRILTSDPSLVHTTVGTHEAYAASLVGSWVPCHVSNDLGSLRVSDMTVTA